MAVVSESVGAQTQEGKRMQRPEVLFFDSNESMLDLSGMKPQVTEAFEGREDLMALWFSNMLFHSLVDTVTSNYHDFGTIGAACMQMVAEGHGIKLDKAKAKKAMAAMKTLPVWPDVPLALKKLKESGFRLYTFTNSAAPVIESQVKHNEIEQYFDGRLTTAWQRLPGAGARLYRRRSRAYSKDGHHVPLHLQHPYFARRGTGLGRSLRTHFCAFHAGW